MKHRILYGIALLALALPCAAQVSVVGCIFDSTTPQITDDPNRCAVDNRLDVVSIKGVWTQSTTIGSATGGAGAGKVQQQPFVIVKHLDRASPRLFLDVTTGRVVRSVLVGVFDTDSRGRPVRVFSFLLEDVFVSSLEFDAADSRSRGAMPMDQVSFVYARLTVREDSTGVSQGFDFTRNAIQ
jgi:type VI secretion system Hcp family effector